MARGEGAPAITEPPGLVGRRTRAQPASAVHMTRGRRVEPDPGSTRSGHQVRSGCPRSGARAAQPHDGAAVADELPRSRWCSATSGLGAELRDQ
jgi:hypothetical protein